MAQVVKEVHRTIRDTDDDRDAVVADEGASSTPNVIGRVIYFIGGVIISILAIRFLLSLLGANRNNGFADLIYDLSAPLVAPFFGLFNYTMQYGVSRFEFETLIAIMIYGLITAGLAYLVTIDRRRTAVE